MLEITFLKRIRKELYKKEAVYTFLKGKEQEGTITNKQKNVLKNIDRYFKKLNSDLRKLQKTNHTLKTKLRIDHRVIL